MKGKTLPLAMRLVARTRCTNRYVLLISLWLYCLAAQAATLCAPPGAPGRATLSGIINHYWEPADNQQLAPGTRRIQLLPGQPLTALAQGDVLLVIQMQGAQIAVDNSAAYGGGQGAGWQSLQAGHFEWVRVAQLSADTILLQGSGPQGGLRHGYVQRSATAGQGARRFQLVRVPQYEQVQLQGNLSAVAWNGRTGGILALEVRGELDFNGHWLDVSGQGFRGGAALALQGGVGDAQDYVFRAPTDRELSAGFGLHASKGEGLAGTPRYLLHQGERQDSWPQANSSREADGYPVGSMARGAPANAGGGGASARIDNRYPASGGGGAGGRDGQPGTTPGKVAAGGLGGRGVAVNQLLLTLGGGGGAATRASGQDNGGSGGSGGGIIVLRAGELVGSGGFRLEGAPGLVAKDAGGGGGGGGSLWLESPLVPSQPIPVLAAGGAGGEGRALGGSGGAGRLLTGGGVLIDSRLAEPDDALHFSRADSRALGVAAAHRCRPLGMLISGEVYIDNGGSEGLELAHDGRRHLSEAGLGGLRVWLEDGQGNPVQHTTTNANGLYALLLERTLARQSLALRVAVPESHQVVTATVADLPSHPFQWLAGELPQSAGWRFHVQPEHHQDQVRLGLIPKPQLLLPENRQVQRGSTQLFLIQYLPSTHGQVRFTLDAAQQQAVNWKHTFFIDPTCREESHFMDQQRVSRWFTVVPDTPLCVRLRVDIPEHASPGTLTVTVGAESRWPGQALRSNLQRSQGSFMLQLEGR